MAVYLRQLANKGRSFSTSESRKVFENNKITLHHRKVRSVVVYKVYTAIYLWPLSLSSACARLAPDLVELADGPFSLRSD